MNVDYGVALFIYISGVVINVSAFLIFATFLATLERGKSILRSVPKPLRVALLFTIAIPWIYPAILFFAMLCFLVALTVYTVHEFLET